MSELRIIPVVFGGKHFIITDHRMQYDYGQVLDFKDLELPDSFEARFSNSPVGESVGQIGTNNRIRIPKQFFESGEPIYCYITLHDEVTDGRTVYTTKVPIKPSSERTEEEPEPEEESIITQAISALNTAVEKTAQDVISADALVQAASEQADRAEQAAEGVEGYAERAEAAQSAAESARDRATQAETSARTSAATATEKASEAISSATTASQSAITAENASESAQEYASASAESASQASQSADTASGKASDASESAQTASQKATEASKKASEAAQSASTAVQAKTDAQSAKTASETAQGLAESARDGAVTAKNDAESARDEAQNLVDGITGKVEQIDSNTDRIESLEDDRYKPYPTDTASGSIASFPDGADDIPLKSCIVRVEPVQAGSGDPSPDNVRPISGWTGCEVQRTGVNVWDEEWENGTFYLDTGEKQKAPDYWRSKNMISVKPLQTYYFMTSGDSTWRFMYDENKQYVGYLFGITNIPWQIPANVHYINIVNVSRSAYDSLTKPISINYPSTDHDYHPYQGETYPITFPTEAGTVYGGYIDPINGELVVTHQVKTFDGTENWSVITDTNKFYINMSLNDFDVYDAGWISDKYPYGGYINNSGNINIDHSFYTNHNVDNKLQDRIFVFDTSFADVEAFKASLVANPLTVYGKLKEPIHYPINSIEIRTLLGQNNLWADTGDTEVEYRADVKLYINKKIAEAISALS